MIPMLGKMDPSVAPVCLNIAALLALGKTVEVSVRAFYGTEIGFSIAVAS